MSKINILYTRKTSIYHQFPVECWDEKRDARRWPGLTSVIAHPPCRGWGKLRHLAKVRPDEKALAVHAVIMVRLYGGILEHPEGSQLWKAMEMPLPGQKDKFGGWTLSIHQKWFGHRAQKRTWLYIVGIGPKAIEPYPITLHQKGTTVEQMGKAERERTPEKLAVWLITTAITINNKKLIHGTQSEGRHVG